MIDCLIADPNNPLATVFSAVRAAHPAMKISVCVCVCVRDMIDYLAELHAKRPDISIVGAVPA